MKWLLTLTDSLADYFFLNLKVTQILPAYPMLAIEDSINVGVFADFSIENFEITLKSNSLASSNA